MDTLSRKGKRLKGVEKYQHLYHYTSFDTFVKIWLSGKLLFGDVQKVNDVQENDVDIYATNPQQWAVIMQFRRLRLAYKQISLCMDYDEDMLGCMSTQMWAYYANNKGVCIELDYSKLIFPSSCFHGIVRYRNYTNDVTLDPSIKSTCDLKRFIKKNHKKLFFTKQFTWKGENEYRIVSDNLDGLDISKAISAIYVLDSTSIQCSFLHKLVGDSVPIKRVKFSGRNGILKPKILDAVKEMEEREKQLSDPKGFHNSISRQVEKKLEECKDDEKASLLMPYLYFQK